MFPVQIRFQSINGSDEQTAYLACVPHVGEYVMLRGSFRKVLHVSHLPVSPPLSIPVTTVTKAPAIVAAIIISDD